MSIATASPGPTANPLKKWAILLAIIVAVVCLGSAATTRWWLPWLQKFAHANKETIDEIKKLFDLVAVPIGVLSAIFAFIAKLWKGKEEPPAAVTKNEQAGRDLIHATGNVQTGGQNITPQRDLILQNSQVVQAENVIYQAAPVLAPILSLHQLPPPPADFQGRTEELADLRAAMSTAATAGKAIISGLQGQGGIGKTTLALKLAEEISPRYPDAQIYLDLKGVSEMPVPVSEAFAHVIRSFDPNANLPESQPAQQALYRSVLHGKRALLLMDNARDAAQVTPLLPPPGCAFLVTSRRHFTLPGLFAKDLNTLPPPDAEALLVAIAPRIDGHTKTIARLCGFLPQALRLAASALANRLDLAPADYVRQLSDEKRRLQLLKESDASQSDQSVEASIGLSYALLVAQLQKPWRSLGVFPDTFDVPAATAVWEMELATASGAEIDPAQNTLGALLQYSMLEWNEASRRYRLHDLMRDFSRARLSATETQKAGKAHASHYLAVLKNADALYKKGGNAILQALALFDLEWGNVQAGQSWAASHAATDDEAAQLCSGYPDWGANLLALRQHPREQIRWREAALSAARNLKDHSAEGRHLGNLGNAYYSLGEYRRAIEFHEQHLAIAREIGHRLGEANALGNLGLDYGSFGEYRRAIEYYNQRLAIAREIGDRLGEGHALGNLGNAYYSLGEYRRAIEFHEQSLAIAREIGDRLGEGQALGSLGIAYYSLSEYHRAIEYSNQYLAIAREIGDRKGEGTALGNLGIAYYSLGEYRRAIEFYEQNLAIAREIGHRLGEANALWNISLALDKLGQRQRAIEHARAALQIYEQIESPPAKKVRTQLQQWQAPAADASP